MQILLLVLLLALAGLSIKVAFLLLRNPRRLLSTWFRCSLGATCLVASLALVLVAIDLAAYKRGHSGQAVIYVEFVAVSDSEHVAKLSAESSDYGSVLVTGDAWSLEVRALAQRGLLGRAKSNVLARPGRLNTRYFDLANASRHASRDLVAIDRSLPMPVDSWRILQQLAVPLQLLGVRPVVLHSNYLPVATDARFAVYAVPSGLLVEPVNQAAAEALHGIELVAR